MIVLEACTAYSLTHSSSAVSSADSIRARAWNKSCYGARQQVAISWRIFVRATVIISIPDGAYSCVHRLPHYVWRAVSVSYDLASDHVGDSLTCFLPRVLSADSRC